VNKKNRATDSSSLLATRIFGTLSKSNFYLREIYYRRTKQTDRNIKRRYCTLCRHCSWITDQST